MERLLLNAGDKTFNASHDQKFDEFDTSRPTAAILLYVDATLTSSTTPSAYNGDFPGTLISELELIVNGHSRGTIKGYDLWNMMRTEQREEPEYTATTYADSTALAIDCVFRLNLKNVIPAGVPFSLRVKSGAVDDNFNGAGNAHTSMAIYCQQEILKHNLAIEADAADLAEIQKTLTCDAFGTSLETLSGTPTADWSKKSLPFTDVIEEFLLRVRNNSALSDALITDFAVFHKNQQVRRYKAEPLNAEWSNLNSFAKPTGIYHINLDPDGDRDGFLIVSEGEQFAMGVKHSTVTGTGDLRIVVRKSQALYM